MLALPAGAAGHDSPKQADDYDDQLLHRDHPHISDSPKAAQRTPLVITKVARSRAAVNLSPGRLTGRLVANVCLVRRRVERHGRPPRRASGPGASDRCSEGEI